MLVRMPSAEEYAMKVEKEQLWLPKLAPHLPLPIPTPLAMGEPGEGYPWQWSVYRWIEGETAASTHITDLNDFATHLANFLIALQRIDTTDGPLPRLGNFSYIGGLAVYDNEIRQAIAILKNKIDSTAAIQIWERALETTWQRAPVWVHGDISAGNLLVRKGKLSAVIDFGGLAIGDPACDLVIAWKFFQGKSRETFRKMHLDVERNNDKWAKRIECSYVSFEMLPSILPPKTPRPYIGERLRFPRWVSQHSFNKSCVRLSSPLGDKTSASKRAKQFA